MLRYLAEKRLLAERPRKSGRYSGYSLKRHHQGWTAFDRDQHPLDVLPVYRTDLWLATDTLPSTIGVPTPDNAGEVHEFAVQLKVVSPRTSTWTAAGQLVAGLRRHDLAQLPTDNPFLLGREAAALFRQVLRTDGAMLEALATWLAACSVDPITRTLVVERFGEVTGLAVELAKQRRYDPGEVRELLAFHKKVEEMTRRAKRSGSKTRGPGVLEHRVSPRLEWLTDLGYLTKEGIARNAFEYRRSPSLERLTARLATHDGDNEAIDELAAGEWRSEPMWEPLRRSNQVERVAAVVAGYEMMQRRIGPAPLREVAFAASIVCVRPWSVGDAIDTIMDLARDTPGATLSGGRYGRTPENVYIASGALAQLRGE